MRHELLTILFIRSSYKIRKINLPFLYYQLLKFLVISLFIVFIGLIGLCWYMYSSNQSLKNQLYTLKSQQKNAFLNGPVEKIEPKPQAIAPKDNDIDVATETKGSTILSFNDIDNRVVNIRDFTVSHENNLLNTAFDLVNITEPNQQTGGYLTVMFLNELDKNSKVLNFPENIELNNDFKVVDYKTGDSFSIKYFKKVKFQLQSPNFDIHYAVIRVFSSDGQFIYQSIKSIDNVK